MFKKRRGINLSYIKQGLIYFTCQNVKEQPFRIQKKINDICTEVGGEYYPALYEVLTTDNSIRSISLKHHISESTLYRLRKQFYERW